MSGAGQAARPRAAEILGDAGRSMVKGWTVDRFGTYHLRCGPLIDIATWRPVGVRRVWLSTISRGAPVCIHRSLKAAKAELIELALRQVRQASVARKAAKHG